MNPPDYDISCPKCGQDCTPVALGPDTAPWLCGACHRGYWVTELRARHLYRPPHDDLGYRPPGLVAALEGEVQEARNRGTSLRSDQVFHAHPMLLAFVASQRTVDPGLRAAIVEWMGGDHDV